MGDTNHLDKFREGARAWNAWRTQQPGVVPDLRDLSPNLGEKQFGPTHGGPIDLSDALLNHADLHSAALPGARLANSDLRHANLALALLAGADLSFANLSCAVLDHADLDGATLRGAIVEGARLDLARNLTQAQIDEALGDAQTTLPADLQVPGAWHTSESFTAADLLIGGDTDFFACEPHEVLELPLGASAEDIRSAYLKLAKKYHPDLNSGDPVAERRFKKINQAYHLLTDPVVPPPRRARGTPWAAAMALFIGALAAPSVALYSLGLPPFKMEVRRAESVKAPPTGVATSAQASQSADAEYTGALPASPPAPGASQKPDAVSDIAIPASPAARQDAREPAPPKPEEEGNNPSGEVQLALATESPSGAAAAPGEPASAAPPERMAALESPPAPTEMAANPAEDEWKTLRGSSELLALSRFIQRYRDSAVGNEARGRFRTVVAALDKVDELKTFVRETAQDTPERTLVQHQLALLIEKESNDADHRAWSEARDLGTVAALRAYLAGFPGGQHASQAEERLAAFEEEASGRKRDFAAWSKAIRTATRGGYEAYIRDEPDGRYVADARRKIAALLDVEPAAQQENEAPERRIKARPPGANYRARYGEQEKRERTSQVEPQRAAPDVPHGLHRGEPRWPSPDEPFIERIQTPSP